MVRVYELMPNDSHKSFYGKARVFEDGDTQTLVSYDTAVMRCVNGEYERLWGGWSATTGRHIKAFSGLSKKDWDAMPVKR